MNRKFKIKFQFGEYYDNVFLIELNEYPNQQMLICDEELKQQFLKDKKDEDIVEENVDFDIEPEGYRGFDPNRFRKTFFYSNKGEMAGGRYDQKSNEWKYSLVGDKKEYTSDELVGIRVAIPYQWTDERLWQKMEKDFRELYGMKENTDFIRKGISIRNVINFFKEKTEPIQNKQDEQI
jgi:hypothetical protein